jgi:hypothetical protein
MNCLLWKVARLLLAALLGASPLPILANAQVLHTRADTAVADPSVPRPHTQPLTVSLFQDLTFRDFTPKSFRYSPPPGRRKNWAKVVLVLDFSVTPGRQFDRTARLALGRTNLYFGTTAEPSRLLGPTWHVERDVTEDSALLRRSQKGEMNIGNIVNDTYTGVIHGSAKLLFYPPDKHTPAAETPDLVLPLPNTADGTGSVSASAPMLSETYTFPTNIVRAYLDLITESQGEDEFWYLGVPSPLAAKLQTFGNTAFRETQITVDGKPAGVAPVYPWIYTGGIDPSLWRPLPGVQTLNFVPYRVDLTPFAGIFNDGKPHQIGVCVFNTGNTFGIAGTLRLYRDPQWKTVTGAVTQDTLEAAPRPDIRQAIITANGHVQGPVSVVSRRRFTVAGYVETSRGKIETRITQEVTFSSRQQFEISPLQTLQNSMQETTVAATTTTRSGPNIVEKRRTLTYPLTILSSRHVNPDQSTAQTTSIRQGYLVTETVTKNGHSAFSSTLSNEVAPSDTVLFDARGNFIGHRDWKSAQTYSYRNSRGRNYRQMLQATDGIVTAMSAPSK